MKYYLQITLALLLTSCGFYPSENSKSKSKDKNGKPTVQTIQANDDSDGDLIRDKEEVSLGRNPLVADIPELRIRFIQNYKIHVLVKNLLTERNEEFTIDTKVGRDDPDFKYRVGDIFIRNESFKNAANVGKFSTHTWGEIQEHDLSWVSFPEVDPRFYSDKVIEYRRYFDPEQKYEIKNITVTLENTAKLEAFGGFKDIKNLSLNFYYYDYEKESYELIHTKLVERHFNSGINETFEVVLENVPANLIGENYLKRGEFIISEVGDFDIPEMDTTYKTLLKSVKEKTVPVIYNSPIESRVSYVGLDEKDSSFTKILSTLYGDKFKIEQDVLNKVNQFENNLPDFTYLSELKELDKKGKWFVFTNNLTQHYLDHKYTPKDVISLSYITGTKLANQSNEKIFSHRYRVDTGGSSKSYPLGNISPNSRVEIQLKPQGVWGERKKNWKDEIHSPGGSCGRNCTRTEFHCWHEFNLFSWFNDFLKFDQNYGGELSRVFIVINRDEFSLKTLIEEKKVIPSWIGENLHLSIPDITQIKNIAEFDENTIEIKLVAFQETTFNGVKLYKWGGKYWGYCIPGTINLAGKQGWPLSIESKDFSKWQNQVRWDRVKRGDPKTYKQEFSVHISGIVINNFN